MIRLVNNCEALKIGKEVFQFLVLVRPFSSADIVQPNNIIEDEVCTLSVQIDVKLKISTYKQVR